MKKIQAFCPEVSVPSLISNEAKLSLVKIRDLLVTLANS